MAKQIFLNNATTTLRGFLSTSATSLVVNDTDPFPTSLTNGDWMVVTLDGGGNYYEVMKVIAINGRTWEVVRAQEGTPARLWQPNSRIDVRVTAEALNALSTDFSRGTGSPEGVVTAAPGSLYVDEAGGASSVLYQKESGVGNTGWAALVSVSGGTFTGPITPNQTLGIVGTTTNNNAAAGSVGEYVTNSVSVAGNATIQNITAVSLTPGDWDVFGGVMFTGSGGADITNWAAGASLTPGTWEGGPGTFFQMLSSGLGTDTTLAMPIPTRRISVAVATDVHLVVYGQFTVGAVNIAGQISARRVR